MLPLSFGPHQGVLRGRAQLLERLQAYKVRPAGNETARRFETGTPSFEGQAGVLGTIDYLEWLGSEIDPTANSRHSRLLMAMTASVDYERTLGERLLAGLASVRGLRLYGPATMDKRVPTFAFTLAGRDAAAVARHLAARDIFAWSGHFYAVQVIRRLELENQGLVRVGLCHYSTLDEVNRLIAALDELQN